MNRTPRALAVLALAALAAAPAAAQAPPAAEKNEIVVFGGASILDASTGATRTIGLPELPGWPGLPFPGIGSIDVRTGTSLGSSALFGARYSRYVKDRLAVEADFAVAPTHSLEIDGEVCLSGQCYGRGDYDRAGMGGPFMQAMGRFGGPMRRRPSEGYFLNDWRPGRDVTAWHYGAGLAYDITGGDVRPVVILGAGGVSYSGLGDTQTDFAVRFGAGLKVLFGRVGARVDVVDHLVIDQSLSGDTEHDVHATAGLLVRF
jgi:hypothetical protein